MSRKPLADLLTRVLANQEHPPRHVEAWEWLLARQPWYPKDRLYWNWKKAKRSDRWRPIAMVGVDVSSGPPDGTNTPAGASVWAPERSEHITIDETPESARRVAELWFSRKTRSHSLVFVYGQTLELNAVLKWFAPTWMEDGYVLTPLIAANVMRGMIVRHKRNRWMLCDLEAMTGRPAPDAIEDAYKRLPGSDETRSIFDVTWHWLADLQTHTLREYGTHLRPTIGGTAIRTAGFALPDETDVPKPAPAVVALARAGLGFRGGYIWGQRFQGLAYKADVRRLYAHCLREPLPARWALGRGMSGGRQRPGLFLCTVFGTPYHPPTIGRWDGPGAGFVRHNHTGGSSVCVLPHTEIPGLRALGLRVDVGWGYVATEEFSLSPLVDTIQRVLSEHGADSAIGRVTKLIGNTIYGKFAMRNNFEGVVMSAERPAGDVFPMVKNDGTEMENLWTVNTNVYTPYQQVGAAAIITGAARTILYVELAKRIAEGRHIVHAHTDGYVATGPAPDDLPWETDTVGAWRIVDEDPRTTIVRGGGYVMGDEPKWSGAPGWGRHEIELAWAHGNYYVRGVRAFTTGRPA